eukprot:CAMPEP_0115260918 /NCGR_PEP_ID=MMETSP0270-20121206/48588_1 /TAXON_ID=71861 /ORGANISM="Scrippsiella trochoidea, Strain CCMP3099" /LENGTH=176 /DNA_ID=CAMNT_0002676775 /DNA_START=242 /DNA_END=768 /DNA_ORIENTATION=-
MARPHRTEHCSRASKLGRPNVGCLTRARAPRDDLAQRPCPGVKPRLPRAPSGLREGPLGAVRAEEHGLELGGPTHHRRVPEALNVLLDALGPGPDDLARLLLIGVEADEASESMLDLLRESLADQVDKPIALRGPCEEVTRQVHKVELLCKALCPEHADDIIRQHRLRHVQEHHGR